MLFEFDMLPALMLMSQSSSLVAKVNVLILIGCNVAFWEFLLDFISDCRFITRYTAYAFFLLLVI